MPRGGNGTEGTDGAEQRLNEELASLATASLLGFGRACAADDLADGEPNPEEALVQAEQLGVMRQAIDQLPTDYACVIRYYYFEGCSLETLAQRMDISVSWASRLHARAIAMLSRCLRNRG